MDGDRVHPPGPHQQRVRRVRAAEIAVAAAADDQAEAMFAGETDGGRDVCGALGGEDVPAGRDTPGVEPSRALIEPRLVADVEGVGQQGLGPGTFQAGRDHRG
jgi:hypothetical protein